MELRSLGRKQSFRRLGWRSWSCSWRRPTRPTRPAARSSFWPIWSTWSTSFGSIWSRSLRWPHRLQLRLLFLSQFVLDPNRQLHVRALDLAFTVQHFVELRQRQLLVHRIRFHGFVQGLQSVLQLPLEIVGARRGTIDLAAHERFLFIGQRQFSLMLQHHLWRKHYVAERIHRRMRWLCRPCRLWLLRLVRLLARYQHRA